MGIPRGWENQKFPRVLGIPRGWEGLGFVIHITLLQEITANYLKRVILVRNYAIKLITDGLVAMKCGNDEAIDAKKFKTYLSGVIAEMDVAKSMAAMEV